MIGYAHEHDEAELIQKAKRDVEARFAAFSGHETPRSERKIGARGSYNRRIIRTEIVGDYEWSLHATKGWRRRRIA